MTEPIRIVIPMATPSLNQTQSMHWAKRRDLAQSWGIAIWVEQRKTAEPWPVATVKRKVTIERVGTKLLDRDNLWGGCKIPVDRLKSVSLIRDDSPEWCELEVTQRTCAKGEKPHTVITIEDTGSASFTPPPCP